MITVVGHQNPDTDSTCSPIVYAWYLREYKKLDTEAVVLGELNKEAQFVLNYFQVPAPKLVSGVNEGDKVVLIDTNNPEELIPGYENAEIIEIVDHHKLNGLKTSNIPIVTIRPYGSIPGVVWDLMSEEARTNLPKHIAGLMLAPILSDTLKFTSPTTTDYDKELAAKLAPMAGVNIDEFTQQLFDAKSDLTGMSAERVLTVDSKNFDFGGNTYKVAVLETTNPAQALGMRAELEAEVDNVKIREGLAGMMFFIVDILKSEAHLLVTTDTERALAQKAFGAEFDSEGIMHLPGVVSRKKQMVPKLEAAA